MEFKVKFDLSNDYFFFGATAKIAEVLRELADRVETLDPPGTKYGNLMDGNGNTIGYWSMEYNPED